MKRYIKTEWIDDRTPVNAKNLNKIEDALETLSIDSLDISKIQGVNGIKVVTKDDGGVEISGNIQVVPEVEGQSYDTGKVYFVLDPSNQKVKGLVVAGEFTKLGGEGDGTGDSPLGRVTFRVTTLEDTLGTLETRIGDLESRPVAKTVDLEPVNTKIGQLENRLGTLESRPGTDNSLVERVASLESTKNELVSKDSNLEGRISALESKPAPDFGPMNTKVTGLETRVQTLEEKSIPDVRPIITKNENLESRIGALESKTGPSLEPLETRLSVLEKREVPNIQPLETRIQNLESRPVPENLDTLKSRVSVLEAKETPDLGPITRRLGELESRPGVDLGPLETRIQTLEGREVTNLEPVNTKISGIDERVKVLESRPTVNLEPLETRVQTLEGKTIPDISPLTQRVEVLERKETPDLGPLTNRVKALEGKTIPDIAPLTQRIETLESRPVPENLDTLKSKVQALEESKTTVDEKIRTLESRPVPESLDTLKSRIKTLEDKPEPDLGPINTKVSGIDERVKVLEAKPEISLTPLESRVQALESRSEPNFEPVNTKISGLETKVQTLEGLTSRVQTLEGREIPSLDPLNTKISGLTGRVETLEGRTIPDIQPLTNRVQALENKPEKTVDLGPLNSKIIGLETKVQTLEGRTIPDIQPITDRVAALESAPKPVDKSHDITELQRKVAEHTTSISNSVRRISALESSVNTPRGEGGSSSESPSGSPQSLPSDLVRLSDIEDVVRKSTLFDTEHNTILPELIPEIDTVVKWMKGKGRPDKPGTTENVIQGDEADLTRYISTDGAGTGAWEWEKRGGVWHVVRGDTGWREFENPQKYFGKIKLRRTDDRISIEFGGGEWDYFGTVRLSQSAKFPNNGNNINGYRIELHKLSEGFRSCTNAINLIFDDETNAQVGMVLVGGVKDNLGMVDLRFAMTVNRENNFNSLRIGIVTFPTVDRWPETLGGVASASCPI